jgi:hypothetical protein
MCIIFTVIAVCPNNNEIHIYGNCASEKWEKLHVLSEVSFRPTVQYHHALL